MTMPFFNTLTQESFFLFVCNLQSYELTCSLKSFLTYLSCQKRVKVSLTCIFRIYRLEFNNLPIGFLPFLPDSALDLTNFRDYSKFSVPVIPIMYINNRLFGQCIDDG